MQKIILFLILVIIFMLFAVWIQGNEKKPIEIKPIKIETLQVTQKVSTPKVVKEKPIDILSKLKVASQAATEGIIPSKEEVSKKVLQSLKKTIAKQEIKETVIAKPIVKKVVVKEVVLKKVIKKKIIAKKVKIAQKRKPTKRAKVITKKNIIEKTPITKNVKIVNIPKSTQKVSSKLSREEEVSLYHKKYASTLEVVNISKPFEIKEEKNVPDSHYFKPQKPIATTTNTTPTKFVKTLGVVAISNAYETPLVVPKKVEVAKEGIVSFPNAKIETEEMKKLKFVDTLGVVEVSKDFETIEANKYLK